MVSKLFILFQKGVRPLDFSVVSQGCHSPWTLLFDFFLTDDFGTQQIENEYGSYGSDRVYMEHLLDQARLHLGNNIIL